MLDYGCFRIDAIEVCDEYGSGTCTHAAHFASATPQFDVVRPSRRHPVACASEERAAPLQGPRHRQSRNEVRYPLLTIEEWSAEIKRLSAELDALDRSLEVAKAQVGEPVDRTDASLPQPVASGEPLVQFMATVDIQRQHIAALWRLVTDTLQRNIRNLHSPPPAAAGRPALGKSTSGPPRVWP